MLYVHFLRLSLFPVSGTRLHMTSSSSRAGRTLIFRTRVLLCLDSRVLARLIEYMGPERWKTV